MKLSKFTSVCLATISLTTVLNATEKLNEITIMGDKLDRSLQESTSSIQVFDSKLLENNTNYEDLSGVINQSANVQSTGWGYKIRGIDSYDTNTGIGTTNFTLDGAPLSFFSISADTLTTWDMEQVEILRGPQSTSQGRNSLAGAVVLKTKDPEFNHNGKGRISYGSYNSQSLSLMQTGPITENLAFRLTAQRKGSDGYLENKNLNEDDFSENRSLNLRGKLLYLIGDDSQVLFTTSHTNKNDNGNTLVTGDPEKRINIWNTDGYYQTKVNTHSLEYKTYLNENWDFKAITTFTDTDHDRKTDRDEDRGLSTIDMENENKDFTQEFRVDYKGDKLKASIGLYYANGKNDRTYNITDADASSLFAGLKIKYDQSTYEEFHNYALFLNSDYQLTDKLTIITGLRADRDKRENTSDLAIKRSVDLGAGINGVVDNAINNLVGPGNDKADSKLDNILPKIGFNYKLTENINTGFTYSKGYRPGGVSVNPVQGSSKQYDAEFTNNYELSFKSKWLDDALIANANIFYTKWEDRQLSVSGNSGLAEDEYIENAGESELKGLELETIYYINPKFRLNTSLGYIDTEYKKYENNGTNYAGNEFAQTPNFTANTGLYWENDQNVYLATNLRYSGSSYANSENTLKVSPYTVVDTKIGYKQKDWEISLFANNLFDKTYYTDKQKSGSNYRYRVGAPRVVGINFEYKW